MNKLDEDTLARLRTVLGRIGRLLRQQRQATELDLGYQQVGVLFLIEKMQPVSPGELAQAENVTRPTITRFLNSLEKSGMIHRTGDGNDKRTRQIGLSRRGAAACQQLREGRNRWLAERLAALTDNQRRHLGDAIPALEALIETT
jgi:DNA-binding MarR family transcriptional regulator